MTVDDIEKRFTHYPPRNEGDAQAHEGVRLTLGQAAKYIALYVPEGREQSLAITKLEEAMMWANAALARVRA